MGILKIRILDENDEIVLLEDITQTGAETIVDEYNELYNRLLEIAGRG